MVTGRQDKNYGTINPKIRSANLFVAPLFARNNRTLVASGSLPAIAKEPAFDKPLNTFDLLRPMVINAHSVSLGYR